MALQRISQHFIRQTTACGRCSLLRTCNDRLPLKGKGRPCIPAAAGHIDPVMYYPFSAYFLFVRASSPKQNHVWFAPEGRTRAQLCHRIAVTVRPRTNSVQLKNAVQQGLKKPLPGLKLNVPVCHRFTVWIYLPTLSTENTMFNHSQSDFIIKEVLGKIKKCALTDTFPCLICMDLSSLTCNKLTCPFPPLVYYPATMATLSEKMTFKNIEHTQCHSVVNETT